MQILSQCANVAKTFEYVFSKSFALVLGVGVGGGGIDEVNFLLLEKYIALSKSALANE